MRHLLWALGLFFYLALPGKAEEVRPDYHTLPTVQTTLTVGQPVMRVAELSRLIMSQTESHLQILTDPELQQQYVALIGNQFQIGEIMDGLAISVGGRWYKAHSDIWLLAADQKAANRLAERLDAAGTFGNPSRRQTSELLDDLARALPAQVWRQLAAGQRLLASQLDQSAQLKLRQAIRLSPDQEASPLRRLPFSQIQVRLNADWRSLSFVGLHDRLTIGLTAMVRQSADGQWSGSLERVQLQPIASAYPQGTPAQLNLVPPAFHLAQPPAAKQLDAWLNFSQKNKVRFLLFGPNVVDENGPMAQLASQSVRQAMDHLARSQQSWYGLNPSTWVLGPR